MNQSTLRASLFNVRLAKTDLAPDTSEPSELQIELTLADLLASRKDSASEASNRLRARDALSGQPGDRGITRLSLVAAGLA